MKGERREFSKEENREGSLKRETLPQKLKQTKNPENLFTAQTIDFVCVNENERNRMGYDW